MTKLNERGYAVTDDGALLHLITWREAYGPIPVGWHVHHVDENKANYDLQNLVCLPQEIHYAVHRAQWSGRTFTREQLMQLRDLCLQQKAATEAIDKILQHALHPSLRQL